MSNKLPILDPPSFTEDELRRYRESGDYTPILFEWYKFVGSLAGFVAHIKRDSPAFRQIPATHFHVLTGLLNRCARLMLSNVALSHEGRFGETTAIVDRCIFESSIKIIWLCTDPDDEKFLRFLADGLRTELELKRTIETNVTARTGRELPIEARMLRSIARHIRASGLTEEDIENARRLPDLASMLNTIGMTRLIYVTAQKLGSHHIHGTWPSLLFHYLEEEPAGSMLFVPRGHDCRTHINQFMFVPTMILRSLAVYADYAFQEADEAQAMKDLFASTEDEVMRIYNEAFGNDLTA